jgi:GH15 family glucan-1,4-alpha-glucosidase
VRIGNDAHEQFQLGVFGDVTRFFVALTRTGYHIGEERWEQLRPLIDYLGKVWKTPDQGIWETRGTTYRYVHSTVMAWRAAADLAILAGERRPHDRERARDLARRIRADVEAHGFNREQNAFTAHYGSSELDASILLLALREFLPIDDPRIESSIAAIERHLMVDGYLFRYAIDLETSHGKLRYKEGAFTMCGFWLVQVYVKQARFVEARKLFEHLLKTANDVGIFTEEYDVLRDEPVGNVPQAFSHSGLIDAAVALSSEASSGRGPT